MIPKNEWKHYGAPLHYVYSDHCQYHRGTLVGKYIISTVARLVSPLEESKGWQEIGGQRYGETHVFEFSHFKTCGCPQFRDLELDCLSYSLNDIQSCQILNEGHEEMCLKYAKLQDSEANDSQHQ